MPVTPVPAAPPAPAVGRDGGINAVDPAYAVDRGPQGVPDPPHKPDPPPKRPGTAPQEPPASQPSRQHRAGQPSAISADRHPAGSRGSASTATGAVKAVTNGAIIRSGQPAGYLPSLPYCGSTEHGCGSFRRTVPGSGDFPGSAPAAAPVPRARSRPGAAAAPGPAAPMTPVAPVACGAQPTQERGPGATDHTGQRPGRHQAHQAHQGNQGNRTRRTAPRPRPSPDQDTTATGHRRHQLNPGHTTGTSRPQPRYSLQTSHTMAHRTGPDPTRRGHSRRFTTGRAGTSRRGLRLRGRRRGRARGGRRTGS